jgi:glycolate oxidase FAD binding subunit
VSVVQEREQLRTPGVWQPADTAAVRDAVHDAASMRSALRVVGRGTWLDGGHPVAPDARPIRVDALDGITAYVPGDLTLTARAGTSLSTIEAATAAKNQWLPLDPFASAEHGGSIGATIATASAGPLAHAVGLPRDIVLGLEVVTGEGVIIRTGGTVVKNVAGFDLTRLFTGAWGTLGVLTEVTVRLRGRPARDETLVISRRPRSGVRGDGGNPVDELLHALRAAPVLPLALEILNVRLASHIGVPLATAEPVVLARIAGNAERVAAERAALAAVGDVVEVSSDVWTALRRIEMHAGADVAVLRWAQAPTRLAETWIHAGVASAPFPEALVHASVGRGIVRAIIPEPASAPLAAAIARDAAHPLDATGQREVANSPSAFAGTCIPERLPPWLWGAGGARGMRDALSRRVRHAFDPSHVLNPGILGEETGRD